MNPKELISKARNSPTVGFHKFVLLHSEFKTDLFCFFEGKDTQYYFPRIFEHYGEEHHPIVCGNKKTVMQTFELVSSKYKHCKTAFFIDNDYDDENDELEGVYKTPCYSIENLYCTENVLSRILKNEFMLNVLDEEYISVMKLFNNEQVDFHNATKLFNAWYATAKDKAKRNDTIVNANLDERFPKEFVTLKIGNITQHYTLENILQKFPHAIQITQSEIDEYCKKFDFTNPTMKFRGKYEIEFFYKFLRYIIDDANTTKKILKTKSKFNVDQSQLLSQISQYSETPNCLIEYLKKFR